MRRQPDAPRLPPPTLRVLLVLLMALACVPRVHGEAVVARIDALHPPRVVAFEMPPLGPRFEDVSEVRLDATRFGEALAWLRTARNHATGMAAHGASRVAAYTGMGLTATLGVEQTARLGVCAVRGWRGTRRRARAVYHRLRSPPVEALLLGAVVLAIGLVRRLAIRRRARELCDTMSTPNVVAGRRREVD